MDRRVPSTLACSLVACVTVFGLLVLGAGSASATRVPVVRVPVARVSANARAAAAFSALKRLLAHEQPTNHPVGGQVVLGSNGAKKATSGNWSGYADTDAVTGKYTAVSASWIQPRVNTCGSTTQSQAAFWVGIDGYDSKTVEQDGTLAWCDNGTVYYYTWWEMYPHYGLKAVGDGVQPGDKIKASVTRNGDRYTLRVTDLTNRSNSFVEYRTCIAQHCTDASAEWVAEAPSGPSGQYPLADFGTWTVSDATAATSTKSGGISSFPDYVITMTLDSTVLAQPGTLSHHGGRFTVTWESATS
jgi:hypothetical protein